MTFLLESSLLRPMIVYRTIGRFAVDLLHIASAPLPLDPFLCPPLSTLGLATEKHRWYGVQNGEGLA